MDDDSNSLMSGVDLDSDLSIDPSMLSTPGDRNSTTSFQDLNEMNVNFTDLVSGDASMAFFGQGDVSCGMSWPAQFNNAEAQPSPVSAMFQNVSEAQANQFASQTSATSSFSIPDHSREYQAFPGQAVPLPAPSQMMQNRYAEAHQTPGIGLNTGSFTGRPVFSVAQQPATAPTPQHHFNHQQPQQPPAAPSSRPPFKTVWPGWHAANMTDSPCPIFGGPHPPKIYEYKPPTFGPKGNQDQKQQPPPPPADAHGIRTNLPPREAIADAMKMSFVNGAAWCLRALIRQVNHELKTKSTMFGFKPDKRVRKQEIVNKTVTDYFQSNNPPTLAALSGAEEVGSKFGQYYPDLFLPIPGSKQGQEQQRQQQQNKMVPNNTSSSPDSVPVYMGNGPVPAAFMATVPDTALASVMRKGETAAPNTQNQPQTAATAEPGTPAQTWSPSLQNARTASPATKASISQPASASTKAPARQLKKMGKPGKGKRKGEIYQLTGTFHEVLCNSEILFTWECVDGQYRMMEELYPSTPSDKVAGEQESSPAQQSRQSSQPDETQPTQAQRQTNTEQCTQTQVPQDNGNTQYRQLQPQKHHEQQQTATQTQAQGHYIVAANTGNGPFYPSSAGNSGGGAYTPAQMQQHPPQQQSLYTISPQHSASLAPTAPKRKRAPDTESAAPLTKRRGGKAAGGGSCNPAELMLSQTGG